MTLDQAELNGVYRLAGLNNECALDEQEFGILESRMGQFGLCAGVEVEVCQRSKSNRGPMVVEVHGQRFALTGGEASCVLVQ